MTWAIFLVALSSILSIVSGLPYLIGVVKGYTKPRIVTWLTWSILTGIACVAAVIEKQYGTAVLLSISSILTFSVVLLGWRHGSRKIAKVDYMCLVGVVIGLLLWRIFDSPSLAVIATIIIDFIGGVPTLIHSWNKPDEEQWATFAISAVSSFLTLLSLSAWQISGFAFPLYLTFINLVFAIVIISRKRYFEYAEA